MTHKAKCDRCKYRDSYSSTLRTYENSDGSHCKMELTFVWCSGCRAVRWGEVVQGLAELEAALGATVAREPALLEELNRIIASYPSAPPTLEGLLADRVAKLEERIAWRRHRKSPPRCLECGTTEIVALQKSETRSGNPKWTLAEHPGCGGIVTVLRQPALVLDRGWLRYTPEGERKRAYVMSPSRGAVPNDERKGPGPWR